MEFLSHLSLMKISCSVIKIAISVCLLLPINMWTYVRRREACNKQLNIWYRRGMSIGTDRVMQLTDTRGNPWYPTLSAVVIMSLNVSHGQAYVERGFSINKQVMDERTTLLHMVFLLTFVVNGRRKIPPNSTKNIFGTTDQFRSCKNH